MLKCRYWNRGYCREGNNCNFTYKKEDCQIYLKTREYENRTCQGGHRRIGKYYNSQKGCFRKDQCQYLREYQRSKEDSIEKEPTDINQKNQTFSGKKCNFKTSQEMT